jgi:hypothetical protein
MPTTLSIAEMKEHVRRHFEDFVNNRKPEVIRRNMTEDFFDHDGPGGKPPTPKPAVGSSSMGLSNGALKETGSPNAGQL